MEREYEITGTVDELKMNLEKEFKLAPEEAEFAVSVLVSESLKNQNPDVQEDISLWNQEISSGESRTPLFNTRYSISFTDLGISVLRKSFLYIARWFLNQEEGFRGFVLEAVSAIIENCHHITDVECCVYFTAIRWKKEHRGQIFTARDIWDILPGECIYPDKSWKCEFQIADRCTMDEEKIQNILGLLCEHKVIKQQGRFYDFTR